MNSKISFVKMVNSDGKRRIWIGVVAAVVLLLLMPAAVMLIISNGLQTIAQESMLRKDLLDQLIHYEGSSIHIVTAAAISIISAFSGFRYLYSRQKVDVFHSLPVRREKLFLVPYVSGVLLFLAPYLICKILMLMVYGGHGLLSAALLKIAVERVFLIGFYYLLFYNVAIVAIMLTGKMLVGVLGMLTFWAYFPVLYALISEYSRWAFATWYEAPQWTFFKWLSYLSPVSLYFGIQRNSTWLLVTNNSQVQAESMLIAGGLVLILLTFGLGIWLYRLRNSEAADQAMAFAKVKPVFKVLLLIVISLACGTIMRYATQDEQVGFIIGSVLGLLLSSCLVEVIYSYDIKKAFAHKKSFFIAGSGITILFLVFKLDILGYDRYEPKWDQLNQLAISVDSAWVFDVSDLGYEFDQKRFSQMNLNDVPAAREIIKQGIKNALNKEGRKDNENDQMIWFSVYYHQRNGRKVYRSYQVSQKQAADSMTALFAISDFKKAHYPILNADPGTIHKFVINDRNGEAAIRASVQDQEKLAKALQKDIEKITFQELITTLPFGYIQFQRGSTEKPVFGNNSYPLYSSFKNTMGQLKSIGFKVKTEIEPSEIAKIQVYPNTEETWSREDEESNWGKVYTKKEEIAEILAASGETSKFLGMVQFDGNWVITVSYKNEYDDEDSRDYRFIKGQVPDFIKADLG